MDGTLALCNAQGHLVIHSTYGLPNSCTPVTTATYRPKIACYIFYPTMYLVRPKTFRPWPYWTFFAYSAKPKHQGAKHLGGETSRKRTNEGAKRL